MSHTETHTGKLIPIKTINNHEEFICFVHENDLIDDRTMPIEEFLDEKI